MSDGHDSVRVPLDKYTREVAREAAREVLRDHIRNCPAAQTSGAHETRINRLEGLWKLVAGIAIGSGAASGASLLRVFFF